MGHNFVKNKWIRTKLNLNLYLGMAKQCTEYKMNICKQREEKSGKLIIRDFFSKSKGHNLVKNKWIRTKLILDLYLGMVKPCIKYQMNIRKKVRKTEISLFFSKSKGHNFVKNRWIITKLKLDLYLGMAKQCTKYQINICKQREKKSGKL